MSTMMRDDAKARSVRAGASGGLTELQIRRLEALLLGLIEHHERLERVLDEHRDALAKADAARIGVCVEREQMAGRKLAELDAERMALLREIAGVSLRWQLSQPAGSPDPTKATLTSVAMRVNGPARDALLTLAGTLRAVMGRVVQKQQVIRTASQSLMVHMRSLFEQVSLQLTHTGTYARPGQRAAGMHASAVVSTLDMTS